MKRITNTLIAAAVMLLAFSCVKETVVDDSGRGSKDQAEVVLRLKTPQGFTRQNSRSLTFAEENTINDVYVLAFNNSGQLTTIKKGESVSSTPGSTNPNYSGEGSFTVTLAPSNTTADTYNLVALANAEGILTATIGLDVSAISDKSYAGVMAAIRASITGKMYPSGGVIPMWGESGQIVVSAGANNQTLNLTRSVARIDVGVGTATKNPATDAWTWDGEDASSVAIPFELMHVYVVRPLDAYTAAPNTSLAAGEPTVPAGAAAFTVAQSKANFEYDATASSFGGHTSRDIYIPEADILMGSGTPGDTNHENRMAIVVGGSYNGNGESFYRLDFKVGTSLVNVLRNHLYQFNISKVSGNGYPDVETAYKSLAINMTVNVKEWDETDMGEIKFDGQNFLAVSPGEISLFRESVNANMGYNSLTIHTDASTGWSIDASKIVYSPTGENWLTPSKTNGGTAKETIWLNATENNKGTDRTAIVPVAAGRLTYMVTVSQTRKQPLSLRISPAELYFDDQRRLFDPATGAWSASPTAGSIDIEWEPSDVACDLVWSDLVNGAAMGGTRPAATAATGSETLSFSPAAMTFNSGDPFAEREVMLTARVTNSDGESTTEAISIRQTRFDMLTDVNSSGMALDASNREYGYMLDGLEHSFVIKSNVPWRVVAVADDATYPFLVTPDALVGTSGGVNTTTGSEFKFTVIQPAAADAINYVNASATVELEDPTGKVGNIIVTLKPLVCGAGGVAVPLQIGNGTYLTHMYGGKCWMVQNSKEGTPAARYFGQGGSVNGTNPGTGNGEHYYTYQNAATACPAGWHLPTVAETNALVSEVNADHAANPNGKSKWWAGASGAANGAFAGYYNISSSTWYYWGTNGYWWFGSGGQAFYGVTSGMYTLTSTNFWFSVRCVQN